LILASSLSAKTDFKVFLNAMAEALRSKSVLLTLWSLRRFAYAPESLRPGRCG
jgi:hypothetical protein